jgi:hypothetical protein
MSSSMSQALSSHAKRRGTAHDDIDRSVYTVGQTIASIVNDPRTANQGSGFWGFGADAAPAADAAPPAIDAARYPHVGLADVQEYLRAVHGSYERFLQDRASLDALDRARPSDGAAAGGGEGSGGGGGGGAAGSSQGGPILAALQQVPAQYFSEEFDSKWCVRPGLRLRRGGCKRAQGARAQRQGERAAGLTAGSSRQRPTAPL